MNPRDTALALAITTVIADVAKDQKEALRAELLASLEELGVDAVRAELPGEIRVAKTSIVAPSRKPFVADESSLVDYVAINNPQEVVQRVRDSFKRVFLERLVEGPNGEAVDPDTGEIVPGVLFSASAPYVSTRFDKGGREAVVDAIRSGVVSFALPSNTAGELEA